MNIDPKSETQKPDFDKIARLKFDTEHSRPDDGNEMRAYRQGLEDGYNTLQSENQRLTEENVSLKEYSDNEIQKLQRLISRYSNQDVVISNNQVQIERLTKINKALMRRLSKYVKVITPEP